MAHSYISSFHHCIFSTKDRARSIDEEWMERLWAYIAGIAKAKKFEAIEVGGVEDHLHVIVRLPSTICVADAMKALKAPSSLWVHETFPSASNFAWQEGYGGFSMSKSHLDQTIQYIRNQREHHQKESYQDEFLRFLRINDLEVDMRYIWG